MKTTIFFWAFQMKFEATTGYKHLQEVPIEDTFKIAEDIQNRTGLNVMIQQLKEGSKVLYIDDKRFTQR